MRQKKILTIQDISCTGRCSITVALPLLSACGIETAIVPTSILSTHTGGFVNYHHHDLTDDMRKILNHWKTLDLHFDAIYVGFLANALQVENTIRFIETFREAGTKIYVDPAMADEGELYSLLPDNFPNEMKKLCALADVIAPNMTESCMLLGEPYKEGPYEKSEIKRMIKSLSEINHSKVVMTGVYQNEQQMGAASYDPETDTFEIQYSEKMPGVYYGTGDVFMSTLIGALMNEFSLNDAVRISCDFVLGCIKRNVEEQSDYRYGVDFENGIHELLMMLHKI